MSAAAVATAASAPTPGFSEETTTESTPIRTLSDAQLAANRAKSPKVPGPLPLLAEPNHADQTDPAVRESLVNGEILLAYRRDLSKLAFQEPREETGKS